MDVRLNGGWALQGLAMLVGIMLVAASCGGSDAETTTPGSAAATTTTSGGSATAVAAVTTQPASTGTELPPICSVIEASEMAAILGNEVTIDDSFASDCYYETSAGALGELDSQTSAFAALAEECAFFLPTEAVFPGEVLEPDPDYGDLASLSTTEFSAEYAVCADGLALGVTVRGTGDVTSEQRLTAARAILDLLLERL